MVTVSAVEPLQLILVLALIAVFGIAASLVMRTIDKRDRHALDAQVMALWEALALARHDLRLEVNERGELLHGTVRGVRYTLSVMSRGWSGTLGVTARVARDPAPRLVVWPCSRRGCRAR